MSNMLNWYHDEDNKTSAYEQMVAGQSFIVLRHNSEEIKIPINAWRAMMKVWEKKKWDSRFDDLSCVDECFLVDGTGV